MNLVSRGRPKDEVFVLPARYHPDDQYARRDGRPVVRYMNHPTDDIENQRLVRSIPAEDGVVVPQWLVTSMSYSLK